MAVTPGQDGSDYQGNLINKQPRWDVLLGILPTNFFNQFTLKI
jgi:hypothetical protein